MIRASTVRDDVGRRVPPVILRSFSLVRFGAMVGRMVCIFAACLLLCAFAVHAQVIEEGGFPVKGGGVSSGEAFSLSCPSRLVVQAGSSIVLSCSAAAVPEEGIRYEWESIPGDGLHLLGGAHDLSPLFTAPLSGAGEEYAYRLTATAPGVYETADVTVSVEGFSGDSAHDRGEGSTGSGDCSSFAFEGYREGCSSKDEGSQPFSPFEGFPGEEGGSGFPAPGPFGVPGEDALGFAGGGAPVPQTAPYLDCPPAVFLEELEVGSIECHASDAMGEEFLEYMWEPVGSTTRDYLDNPRLTPEDSPYPSVVAPEAPRYETLESFRSGETTFRYRYRLTATSRATGLSSSSEVEVFVSSSRPSVYCPLEVVIEEGATIALDCEGVDPLSGRMDYDEDGASIEWEWSGLWGTSTAPLAGPDLPSPLFTAPAGSAGKEYHYIASMTSSASGISRTARRRVTVRIVEGAGTNAAPRRNAPIELLIICGDEFRGKYDYVVSTGSDDFVLDCYAIGGPVNATHEYEWDASTRNPDGLALLSGKYIRNPVFSVPDISGIQKYAYYIHAIAIQGLEEIGTTAEVIVTVNGENPVLTCSDPDPVYEGSEDITLDCTVTNKPTGATYSWAGTDISNRLRGTGALTPTFLVPDDVDTETDYTYTVTMSAADVDDVTEEVTVTVLNKRDIVVACADPGSAYEGSEDIAFDCEASGAPAGSAYDYVWTARGDTPDTSLLSAAGIASPTFAVPAEVDADETYKYLLTVSVEHAESATAGVTVTVLNKRDIVVACADPGSAYEGSEDIAFDCEASGAPAGSAYDYVWTARGDTPDTSLLSATGIASPTFAVPAEVDADDDVQVPADRFSGACGVRHGGGDGDGVEQA